MGWILYNPHRPVLCPQILIIFSFPIHSSIPMKYKEYSGYSTEQLYLSLNLYGKMLQKFIVFFPWGRGVERNWGDGV